MPASVIQLIHYLVKQFSMTQDNAMIIVNDEWEYIEEQMLGDTMSIAQLAKELVDIYMVA